MNDCKFLIELADKARNNSYAPYSNFKVGAALLCKDGKVFTGSNIENAAFGASVCAERVAFFKAICEGEREFEAISIVGGKEGLPCAPCGTCRQVMSEFCGDDFKVVLSDKTYRLDELLPLSFGRGNLR